MVRSAGEAFDRLRGIFFRRVLNYRAKHTVKFHLDPKRTERDLDELLKSDLHDFRSIRHIRQEIHNYSPFANQPLSSQRREESTLRVLANHFIFPRENIDGKRSNFCDRKQSDAQFPQGRR
jgi:hypothetical protein